MLLTLIYLFRRYKLLVLGICLIIILTAFFDKQGFNIVQAQTINKVSGGYFGEPIPTLSSNELQEYEAGFNEFIKIWTQEEGLGPFFNAESCVACHRTPLPGGSGTTHDTFVLHSPEVIDIVGGTSFPRYEVAKNGVIRSRFLPSKTTIRKTQPLFGLGLLEAVPDEVLLEYVDPNDKDRDEISGRLAKVNGQYSRFGWKGDTPTIERFIKRAFASEIGIKNNVLNNRIDPVLDIEKRSKAVEITEEQVYLVSQFIRFLAAPPTPKLDRVFLKGKKIFTDIDCAKCHRLSLLTGNKGTTSLRGHTISAYTDLLLHDMGASLSDGIKEGDASEQEFRTPPLWGLGFTGPPYLHDGRALTIEQAIETHDGEAKSSLQKYEALTHEDRQALLKFLKSL